MARSPPLALRAMPGLPLPLATPKRTPARLISKSFSRKVPSSELWQTACASAASAHAERRRSERAQAAHSSYALRSSGTRMGAGLAGFWRRAGGAASIAAAMQQERKRSASHVMALTSAARLIIRQAVRWSDAARANNIYNKTRRGARPPRGWWAHGCGGTAVLAQCPAAAAAGASLALALLERDDLAQVADALALLDAWRANAPARQRPSVAF